MNARAGSKSAMTPLAQVDQQLLVLRCQAGDAAAFVQLVQRHGSGVRYYLRRFLAGVPQRDAVVEDALQDVWFGVFRGVAGLREPKTFVAWLYRIARDRAAQELRRSRLRHRFEAPASEVPAPVHPPEERLLAEERADLLQRAIERLPLEQRDILVLRFMVGLTYDDVAEVLGCPLGTVRSRLHYACRALRQLLPRQEVCP